MPAAKPLASSALTKFGQPATGCPVGLADSPLESHDVLAALDANRAGPDELEMQAWPKLSDHWVSVTMTLARARVAGWERADATTRDVE